MAKRKAGWLEATSMRLAVARDRFTRRRTSRFGNKRTMTLLLGAALSVGGVGEAFDRVHFVVERDLDETKVVRKSDKGETVVARLDGAFAAASIYKIARALPDSILAERKTLFDPKWLVLKERPEDVESQRLTFFTDDVREAFFKTLPYGVLIHEKSAKYDVDPALVAAVMEAESRFKQRARSPKGATGLMQLMPKTGHWMGARDLYNPEQNVDAGVKYLKYLNERFDGNLTNTIAAYNAGEGNVMRYRGVPPYKETRTYVKRVMKNYEKRNKQLEEFSAGHSRERGAVEEAR